MMVQDVSLLHTPLHAWHKANGAKLVGFGGWDMPLQFSKVLEEHHAVRKVAGLFDISHMGILSITGPDSTQTMDALNALVPQDLITVYAGKAVYTQFLNSQGGILDDILVYHMPQHNPFEPLSQWMVICNAGNTHGVRQWLEQHLPPTITTSYLNSQLSLIALQGPQFNTVLQQAGLQPSELPKRFHIGEYSLYGLPVLLSRTGYTGEDGVEILASAAQIEHLWTQLLQHGETIGLQPVGLAARDTLRLEAAYPLHGSDITEAITPLEAGLGWSVKLAQANDFIGKAALLQQQQDGLSRHFVCLEVLSRTIPRHHDTLHGTDGQSIGLVTSGSISPTLDKPIAVGYIHRNAAPQPGDALQVSIRGKLVPARIVKRPFYPQS